MTNKTKVLKFLWEKGSKTTGEIARHFNFTLPNARMYCVRLQLRGTVTRKKGSKKTSPVTWSVVRTGSGFKNVQYYIRRDYGEEINDSDSE